MRSHLYLLPGYTLASICPSYRKAAQIDSRLEGLFFSLLPYPSFKVRGGEDPEIEMTTQLLCFIGDIDVKEDGIKNGLWMYF